MPPHDPVNPLLIGALLFLGSAGLCGAAPKPAWKERAEVLEKNHRKALALAARSKEPAEIEKARRAWRDALKAEILVLRAPPKESAPDPGDERRLFRRSLSLRLLGLLLDLGRDREATVLRQELEAEKKGSEETRAAVRRLVLARLRARAEPAAALSYFSSLLRRSGKTPQLLGGAEGACLLVFVAADEPNDKGLSAAAKLSGARLKLVKVEAPRPRRLRGFVHSEPGATLRAALGIGALPSSILLDQEGRALAFDPSMPEVALLLAKRKR